MDCRSETHAEYFGLRGVLEKPSMGSTRIPSIVFCVYQLMFAAITYVISGFAIPSFTQIRFTVLSLPSEPLQSAPVWDI